MPESRQPQEQELELQDPDLHGPWPEEEDTKAARKKGVKGYLREHPGMRLALFAGLIVLIAAGVFIWHYYSVRESTDDAQVDGHITPISSRVSGTVTALHFQDNQYVEAGTVLVELDPRDYQVAVDRTRAELADAQAAASAARTNVPISHIATSSGIETAQANRNATQQEVDSANARLREARATTTRLRKTSSA